ncbi:MAG: tetratricopeptide repeat protein [Myxococcales bacterium]|nr:tetratricopeptide repeat protein [Myxococcales bacterium]
MRHRPIRPRKLGIALCLLLSACITRVGPKVVPLEPMSNPPILRMGSLDETLTGSWAQTFKGDAFKPAMLAALQESGPATLFSSDPSSLTLNIHLTSNHQSDEPRLAALGLFSILTLGVIPAYYSSEWKVQCDAAVVSGEGLHVAEYHLSEKGTYRILAFPPTMFTLLGAGTKRDADSQRMMEKTANNLTGKLMRALARDYPRLAKLRESNVPSLSALGGGPTALLERGRAHLEAGRLEKARADMMRYGEHEARLLGALNSVTALDFYDTDRRRTVTLNAQLEAEQMEAEDMRLEAFQLYRRAYGWSPGEDSEIAQLRATLVRIYPALANEPKLPEAARRFFVEGQALARADDFVGAVEAFEKVTAIVPWFPSGHFNLALVQERAGRYGSAIASMQTFLKLAPDSENARLGRDRMYEWRSHVPSAPADY